MKMFVVYGTTLTREGWDAFLVHWDKPPDCQHSSTAGRPRTRAWLRSSSARAWLRSSSTRAWLRSSSTRAWLRSEAELSVSDPKTVLGFRVLTVKS